MARRSAKLWNLAVVQLNVDALRITGGAALPMKSVAVTKVPGQETSFLFPEIPVRHSITLEPLTKARRRLILGTLLSPGEATDVPIQRLDLQR